MALAQSSPWLKADGVPQPGGLVLYSPWLDGGPRAGISQAWKADYHGRGAARCDADRSRAASMPCVNVRMPCALCGRSGA